MANAVEDFGNHPPFSWPLLHQALKEWAIALHALATGEQQILLRKGGIQDPRQPFAQLPNAIALFPTYEHQVPHHLKDPARLQGTIEGNIEPQDPIPLSLWATLTHRVELRSESALLALMPFHIWNEAFLTERLKWRPQQPITVLVLRVYHLPEEIVLERSPAYSGCRSWVTLPSPIATQGSRPVLSDAAYQQVLASITHALEGEGTPLEAVPSPVEME